MGTGGSKQNAATGDILSLKVSQIMSVEKKSVVELSPEDTFETALKLFHENNILSAPIIDDDGVCQGFFAMDDVIIRLDIISKRPVHLGSNESPHIREDAAEELAHRAQLFLQHKVKEAIDEHRSSGSMYLGIRADQTIRDALLAFATGVQRIAVFNSSKQIIAILSQSTLLRFLAEDTKRLGALENEPAQKLGIPWSRLVKLTDKALVLDAVEMMHKHSVYSLPIVDSSLKLVAHISMSDFKRLYLTKESLDQLLLPVMKFIREARQAAGKDTSYIVSVPKTATLRDVVVTMVKEHVHQLYLVDPSEPGTPLSLISMTNVCHKLFSHHHLKETQHQQQQK